MRIFTVIGIILILLGIIFVPIPVLEQYINLAEVPSWLIYVYRRGNFYFATSPILLLASILFLMLKLLFR